jgi:TatD DNase family protein
MIDSHTHLAFAKADDAELVAAAREVGVTRMLTVGIDAESCRQALDASERFDGVWAAIGRHPNAATGFTDADLDELRELARHPRCAAIGETGFDFFRNGAPREDQERAFRGQIELAKETGKPLVIHSRDADDATIDALAAHADGLDVILHCFSMPDHLDACVAHERWIFSFAGNVTYPSAAKLAWAAGRVPADRLLVETDAPYLTPQAVRKERNQPAFVVHTARLVAEARGLSYEQLEALVEANAARLFAW